MTLPLLPQPASPEAGLAWTSPDVVCAIRSLWKATPDAMVLSDATGTVRAANPAYCARHGSTPQLLIGQSFASTYPLGQQGAVMEHYGALFASRETPDVYPAVSQWRDDQEQVTESRIAFVTQPDGQAFMLASVRVIEERLKGARTQLSPINDPASHGDGLGSPRSARAATALQSSVIAKRAASAAELVVAAVTAWGIEVVFGLPGASASASA